MPQKRSKGTVALSLTNKGVGRRQWEAGAFSDYYNGAASQGPSLYQKGLAAKLCHPHPHPQPLFKQAQACCCMETGACSCSKVTWLPSSALFVSA